MPVRAALNREYVDDRRARVRGRRAGAGPAGQRRRGGRRARPGRPGAALGRVARRRRLPPGRRGDRGLLRHDPRGRRASTTRPTPRWPSERIAAILADCVAAHGLEAAAAEHRTGTVPLGEPSVIVAVSAAHRGEAFAGAREAIDRIKAEAPIWKREVGGWRAGVGRGRRCRQPTARASPISTRPAAPAWSTSARSPRRSAAPAPRRRCGCRPRPPRRSRAGDAPKGDVLGTARLAGIGAAKRTWELIPLAHPLALDFVDVDGRVDAAAGVVTLSAEAGTTGQHRGRDGGDDRLLGRRADRLRHGQGDRARRRDRGGRAGREERRAQRRVGAGDR